MIELRWMKTGDGHEDNPITLTLQYRQEKRLDPAFINLVWTEWQDVPVVVVDRHGFTGYSGSIKSEQGLPRQPQSSDG